MDEVELPVELPLVNLDKDRSGLVGSGIASNYQAGRLAFYLCNKLERDGSLDLSDLPAMLEMREWLLKYHRINLELQQDKELAWRTGQGTGRSNRTK